MKNRWLILLVGLCLCAMLTVCAGAEEMAVHEGTNTVSVVSGEETMLRFVPTESSFHAFVSESDSDLYATLYDGSYEELITDDDGGEGSNFCLEYLLQAGETYYVSVQSRGSSDEDFLLNISRMQPEQVREGTNTVSLKGDKISWVRFVPAESGFYVFNDEILDERYAYQEDDGSYTYVDIDVDTFCYLHDSGFTEIAIDDDGGDRMHFSLRYYLEAGETYYLGVRAWGNYVDSLVLHITREETQEPAQLHEGENTVTAVSGEETKLPFVPEKSGFYAFASESDSEHEVALYDADDEWLDSYWNGGSDNTRLRYAMQAGETYYVGLLLYGDTDDDILLNITYIDAEQVSDGDTISEGNSTVLAAGGEETKVTFVPEVSGFYEIAIENNVWPDLIVYDGDNEEVSSYRRYWMNAGETYTVGLQSYEDYDEEVLLGIYRLPVETVTEGSRTLVKNGGVNSYFVTYKFVPEADGIYQLALVDKGYYDSSCRIYDGTGHRLDHWDDAYDSHVFEMSAGKVYYICLQMYSDPGVMHFTVSRPATSGTCGANVTWSYAGGTLTIGGTGDMQDYDCEADDNAPWYDLYRRDITHVDIAQGVTSIGDYAFCDCNDLTSITIADSVTSIGKEAFNDYYLTIYCGEGSYAEQYAIDHNIPYHAEIRLLAPDGVLPASLKTIGEEAFVGTDFRAVEVPDGVTEIGACAFADSSLKQITIPASVTEIASDAFDGCDSSLVIVCPSGSKAEEFAAVSGFRCVNK